MLKQVAAAAVHIAWLAVPVWIALRLGIFALAHARGRSLSLPREGVLFAALCYGIVLIAVTLYPLPVTRHRVDHVKGMNMVPIVASLQCLKPPHTAPPETRLFCVENIAGNVALFLPVGLFVLLLAQQRARLALVLLAGLAIAGLVETAQYAEQKLGVYRSVDIDDMIFNVTGACLGYLILVYGKLLRPIGVGSSAHRR